MGVSRVTRKGQVTIPREVRETLGIAPGDSVEIVSEGNRAVLSKSRGWLELFGELAAETKGLDLEELRALAAGAWVERAARQLQDSPKSQAERGS